MDAGAFLTQSDDYRNTSQARDSIAKLLNLMGRSHPFAVSRAGELRDWVVSGDYNRILSGEYPSRVDDRDASVRDEIAATLRSYRDKAESSNDPLVKLLRDVAGGVSDAAGDVADRLRGRFGRGGGDAPAS
jgi:hypothetical protein